MAVGDAVSSRAEAVDAQDSPPTSTKPSAAASGGDGAAPAPAIPPDAVGANVERILVSSNTQLRWWFRISVAMSAVLFVFGVAFLAVAVAQALDGDLAAAAVIAGIGLAAFVLLYFVNPRRNEATNLAGSEQVHIVATSYLAGLDFAEKHDEDALTLLNQLTAHSIALLDDRAEGLSEQRLAALRAATMARARPLDKA
jgi:hypothetical protein